MSGIETVIQCPPGSVTDQRKRALLELFFGDDSVFEPKYYGKIAGDSPITEEPVEVLTEFWQRTFCLTVTRSNREYIIFRCNRQSETNWHGKVTWVSQSGRDNPQWRDLHERVVTQAMELLGSPLAYAGLSDDIQARLWKWVSDGVGGEVKTQTVRVPQEGLPGVLWRLFVASPFADALNLSQARSTANTVWLFETGESPRFAATEAGVQVEKELIQSAGPEYFYDFENDVKPTVNLLQTLK